MKNAISTPNAPKAIGPYEQAIMVNGTVYVSGQLPLMGDNELISDHLYDQTLQSLRNIEAILHEAGLKKENIVKLTVFLTKIKEFDEVNLAFKDFFKTLPYPARSTVEVCKLPLGVGIEIDAIAQKY